jgi:hypothetical protein
MPRAASALLWAALVVSLPSISSSGRTWGSSLRPSVWPLRTPDPLENCRLLADCL